MGIPLCTLQANSNTQYVDLQFSGRLGRPQIEARQGRGFQSPQNHRCMYDVRWLESWLV
jgi:hypothetical protein